METIREEAPSSYLMKLVGFSDIKLSLQPYESTAFNASGYKWRLIFYPTGKEDEGGKTHISVYARIENIAASEMLMNNWEVNVELKFFIYNHNIKKYSTFQDGTVKHYNNANKEWGIAQMLLISKFNNPQNGYIDEDSCIIGFEIFVIKPIEKLERVVFTHNLPNNKFTWKISHFSKLDKKYHYSDEFVVGDRKWKMMIRPKGSRKDKRALSVYFHVMAYLPNAVICGTYAKMKVRILNQKNSNHIEKTVFHFYPRQSEGSRKHDIISLEDLNDESKGYLVNDTIVLETFLTCVSETKFIDSI